MPRFHAALIPAALFAFAGTAHAQRWGGSPAPTSVARSSAAQPRQVQANAGSWNGTVSKWGGSPVQQRAAVRPRVLYAGQVGGYYIPVPIAAVPAVTYAADTTCPPATVDATQPVEMQVISSSREPRELTTIEVYRLQPRFQKP